MAPQYFQNSSNSGNAFALYGAAQSPRDTHSEIRSLMRSNGSGPSPRDSSAASISSSSSSQRGNSLKGLKNVFA
ncbi:hypothetical protein RSAG8_09304, partial [Rhizoctonia solani AG-8 WAC10335]